MGLSSDRAETRVSKTEAGGAQRSNQMRPRLCRRSAQKRANQSNRDRVNFGVEALHYRIEHPRELLSMSFFLVGCAFADQLLRAALEC
jgi:hypothetical protein